MAKSVFLYGVFLGAFICLCYYFNGLGVNEVMDTRFNPSPTVILSETQCSRKISPLKAEPVRHAISPFPATNKQIYSLVHNCRYSLMLRSSPFRSTPVEKTVANEAFDATSLNADLIRKQIKQIYTAEIGVREKTGNNDGERVEEYLAVTQLGTGYAWCAAFVSWVFAKAGFPEPRTPWSPALFPKNRVIWERGKSVLATNVEESGTKLLQASTRALEPNTRQISDALALKPNTQNLTAVSGDVFGIYFANLKRIAHVGFVDEWGDKQIITVEGNTNEAGSGEGDGVYRKRRPISSIYQVANWIIEEKEP